MARRRRASPAKPAIVIAAGLLLGIACVATVVAMRRRSGQVDELLPPVDVAAYNDALLSP